MVQHYKSETLGKHNCSNCQLHIDDIHACMQIVYTIHAYMSLGMFGQIFCCWDMPHSVFQQIADKPHNGVSASHPVALLRYLLYSITLSKFLLCS